MEILQSSTFYKNKILEVQIEITDIQLAGVKIAGDGQSKIEYEKRLDSLIKLETYLHDFKQDFYNNTFTKVDKEYNKKILSELKTKIKNKLIPVN